MVDRLIVDVHHRRMELIGNTKRTRWRRGLDTGDESVLGHIGKFYGFVVAMKNGHRRNGAENFFLKDRHLRCYCRHDGWLKEQAFSTPSYSKNGSGGNTLLDNTFDTSSLSFIDHRSQIHLIAKWIADT
jgi:hypothetical protein